MILRPKGGRKRGRMRIKMENIAKLLNKSKPAAKSFLYRRGVWLAEGYQEKLITVLLKERCKKCNKNIKEDVCLTKS